jgi:hypothetical protein
MNVRKQLKKKVVSISVGLLAGLVLAEILLRTRGLLITNREPRASRAPPRDVTY